MDLLNQLTAGDLITFIGLCLAAFAFLSGYLSFPKNFLVNLKSSKNSGIIECDEQKASINRILVFFFVVDFITAWILVFLMFSIFIIIGFLIVRFQLVWCNDPFYLCLKWYIWLISIVYLILMNIVIYITNKMREKYWDNNSRKKWISFFRIFVIIHSLTFIYISSSYLNTRLDWIFIWLLFFLASLFCILIYALACFNPLTELAKYKGLIPNSKQK